MDAQTAMNSCDTCMKGEMVIDCIWLPDYSFSETMLTWPQDM